MSEDIENVFDSYCKKILRNAAIDFQRSKQKIYRKEVSLELLDNYNFENLCIKPFYEVECRKFKVYSRDIIVKDENLIDVLEKLDDEQTNIILLYYFLDMTDAKIGKYINKSRKAVNKKRLKTLNVMKRLLEDISSEIL